MCMIVWLLLFRLVCFLRAWHMHCKNLLHFHLFVLIFLNWLPCPSILFIHAPVNCFRRKLLHEHNQRGWLADWLTGDINMGNMQRGHQYVFGMGIFPQILLAIYRSAAFQLHASWLSCKKLILSWGHFYEEIKSTCCKLDSRLAQLIYSVFPLKYNSRSMFIKLWTFHFAFEWMFLAF